MKNRLILIFLTLLSFSKNVYPTENEIRPFSFEFYNFCKTFMGDEKLQKCTLGDLSQDQIDYEFLKDPSNPKLYEPYPFYKKELQQHSNRESTRDFINYLTILIDF